MKVQQAFLVLCSLLVFACSKANSVPTYKYYPAGSDGIAVKAGSLTLTEKEVMSGIGADIYEKEAEIFEIKKNKIKSVLMEKFMEADPNKKGMSNDDYMNKYISNKVKISEKEIEAFIAEKKIPKEQIVPEVRDRIKQILEMEGKRKAVDEWLASKIGKEPVQVFINKPRRPTFDIKLGDAPTVGDKGAKVTIVEFSDFQCPYCQKGAEIIGQLKKKYGSKVQIAFKNFPLPFHNQAKDAAVAGLCAKEQSVDSFWKMHDAMFADQSKLDIAGLKATAAKLGLKAADFDKCLDGKKYLAKVEQDYQEGQGIEVKSTPTFFINGQILMGAHPIEVFSEIIDEAL